MSLILIKTNGIMGKSQTNLNIEKLMLDFGKYTNNSTSLIEGESNVN